MADNKQTENPVFRPERFTAPPGSVKITKPDKKDNKSK